MFDLLKQLPVNIVMMDGKMRMKRVFIQVVAILLAFVIGAVCGYRAGSMKNERESDSGATTTQKEPGVPSMRGVFSWHAFEKSYRSVLEKYDIDQVYQCYDEALAKEDYDAIRENLHLMDGYDVWLLTGASDWGEKEMIKMVREAEKVGGFRGVVFDVEPDAYDKSYVHAVEKVCEESSMDIMFCLPYWADDEIAGRVIAASEGVLVMNYDKGNEYRNISSWIDLANKEDTLLFNVYELQPPNEKYKLKESGTYNGDVRACEKNFDEQFAGIDGLGIAFHYIRYME